LAGSSQGRADAPDLWEVTREEREWITSTPTDPAGNTPFTQDEREQIRRHLGAIEERLIRENDLADNERQYVREQFKYLSEAADRVGPVDGET
jgi:hypothetical protein